MAAKCINAILFTYKEYIQQRRKRDKRSPILLPQKQLTLLLHYYPYYYNYIRYASFRTPWKLVKQSKVKATGQWKAELD